MPDIFPKDRFPSVYIKDTVLFRVQAHPRTCRETAVYKVHVCYTVGGLTHIS